MFCNKNKIEWDDFDGLRETVKYFVKEKRFGHILGVENEAVKIGGIFGADEEFIKRLRTAAILHDITKEFSVERHFEVFKEYDIYLSEEEKNAEWSYHAKSGAYVSKFEFGADGIIFGGIYNHTDKSDLKKFPSLFNKIIHLADWIEPNRTYGQCIAVRGHFYHEIEKAENIENIENIERKHKIIDETIFDFIQIQ